MQQLWGYKIDEPAPPAHSLCTDSTTPSALCPRSAGETPVDQALRAGHSALLDLINTFEIAGGAGVEVEFEGQEGEEGQEEEEGAGGGGGAKQAAAGNGSVEQQLVHETQHKLDL